MWNLCDSDVDYAYTMAGRGNNRVVTDDVIEACSLAETSRPPSRFYPMDTTRWAHIGD